MRRLLSSLAQRKTLLNIGALFSGSTVTRILSAFSIFIIARQLGVDRFGVYTATISLAKLTSVFFSLGLDSWLLREGRRRPEAFAAAVGTNLAIKLSLGLLWLVLLAAVASVLDQTSFPTFLVFLAAVSTLLEELTVTAWSAFKAALRNKVTVWLMMTAPTALLLLAIVLALRDVTDIAPYFVARIVSFAFAGALALYLVWRTFRLEVEWGWTSQILRETRDFGLSHGLALIYERADITIIAFALGNTAAGIYAPAVSLVTTLFLIPQAIYEVMLPVLSKIHARNVARVRPLAFRLFLVSAVLGVILGLGMSIIATPLVWLLYGPDFVASGPILVVLSNVLVFKAVSFALAAILAAVGWQGKRVFVQAGAAIFNISVNLAIIGRYGIDGVAHVYVLTEFLLLVGYLTLLLRWQRASMLQAPSSSPL